MKAFGCVCCRRGIHSCLHCPSGAHCHGGSNITAQAGWWQGDGPAFYRCTSRGVCCPYGDCIKGDVGACRSDRLPASVMCSECSGGLMLWCGAVDLYVQLHISQSAFAAAHAACWWMTLRLFNCTPCSLLVVWQGQELRVVRWSQCTLCAGAAGGRSRRQCLPRVCKVVRLCIHSCRRVCSGSPLRVMLARCHSCGQCTFRCCSYGRFRT